MNNQNIQIVDFMKGLNLSYRSGKKPVVQETFIPSHGMTFQHIYNADPKNFANGPRAVGSIEDGYPNRLLGGADSLGIHYKDPNPVISQREIRFVDYSRVDQYNYKIPDVKL